VENFAYITPDRVQLTGVVGTPVSVQLVMTPRKEYPFKVTEMSLQRGGDVKVSYERKQGPGGKMEYAVTLENLKKEPGRYYDNLVIRTDNKAGPELRVPIYGNIGKPAEISGEKSPPANNAAEDSKSGKELSTPSETPESPPGNEVTQPPSSPS